MVMLTQLVGRPAENGRQAAEVSLPARGHAQEQQLLCNTTRCLELLAPIQQRGPLEVWALAIDLCSCGHTQGDRNCSGHLVFLLKCSWLVGDPTMQQAMPAIFCRWHNKNASEAAWPGSCLLKLCISQPAALNNIPM